MKLVTAGARRGRRWWTRGAIWGGTLGTLAASLSAAVAMTSGAAAACANPIACENALPGDPPSDWQVSGIGDTSLQGFATSFSVNLGKTVSFKINDTSGSSYHIDILRLGYYGGNGARKVAPGIFSGTSPAQPSCSTDSSTGLIDCGNWSVTSSWQVPSDAVSGLYMAHLVRDDGRGSSQIPFVVRNDSSHSSILLSTSDATWEAYNDYGGNSLYSCNAACPSPPSKPGGYTAAYAVSYNRPFNGGFNTNGGKSYPYYAEYQMIRWLEQNGYDVSYTSSTDVDRSGSLLLNHNVFMSSGHDEYWSAGQRANVSAARNAGVNLAFFSGNELFWKTRWASSQYGPDTDHRTLITYKETHFNQRVDPADAAPTWTWTGTWQDPGFSPPSDGGQPQNALTGQLFIVNSNPSGKDPPITVPFQDSKLRIWRNTPAASLAPGQTEALGTNTLGYEWDIDAQDSSNSNPAVSKAAAVRPAGEVDLSSTTVNGAEAFTDYGTNTGSANETHHLTLYRAPSGALVFGAGTVQWAWGLDNTNGWGPAGPGPPGAPDPAMQQATVNLLADMCAQPATPMSGLIAAAPTSDTTPPSSSITSNSGGTISGTASDTGGGVIAGVEVSTDGGSTWHPATLSPDGPNVTWTYSGSGSAVESRATNDSGYTEGISYSRHGCSASRGGGTGCGSCATSATTPHPPTQPLASKRLDRGAGILGRTARMTANGRLALWIVNPNSVSALGSLKLTARPVAHTTTKTRTSQIGAARFKARSRAKVKVTILMSTTARTYLARHKSLRTRALVILSSNGTSRTTSATITVQAPRRGRR